MSSTSAPHRPQLTLAGQAHTADGPIDMSSMYVVHHACRRDLGRFAAAVRNTPLDDPEAWRALSRRWERFGAMLHHHHEIEDATIWPPLVQRVDAVGRTVLETMQGEHRTIDPLLAACAAGFDAMAQSPDPTTRDRLAEQVAAARDGIDRHLAHEETDALPLVQRHLPPPEWAKAEDAAKKAVGLRDLTFLVPWAAAGLDQEQRDRAFASGKYFFRLMYGLTRSRFDRRERATFRYA